MKIKVDENIGRDGIDFLREHGHDVMTVREQELGGATDNVVFEACVAEGRTLVTLDRDFGQVPRFPPERSAGIVVLDLAGPASVAVLRSRLREFHAFSTTRPVMGGLSSRGACGSILPRKNRGRPHSQGVDLPAPFVA